MTLLCLLTVLAGLPRGAEARGDTYRAVIAPDGSLFSVRVGAAELLDPFDEDARGGALWDELPLDLAASRNTETSASFRGAKATVTYRFEPTGLRIWIVNAGDGALTWRFHLTRPWRIAERTARTAWGAAATIDSAARVTASPGWWRVACAPFETTEVILRLDPAGIADRPLAEAVWTEPRSLTPWRFVLEDAPPAVDTDGTMMTIPLLLADDRAAPTRLKLTAALVGADGPRGGFEAEQPPLARDIRAVDVRLPPPAPGVYELRVELSDGTATRVDTHRLVFAPERWPVVPPPAAGAVAEPTTRLRPAPGDDVPAGWGRFDLVGDQPGLGARLMTPLAEPAPTVILLGWPGEPGARWARLGLASSIAEAAAGLGLYGKLVGEDDAWAVAACEPTAAMAAAMAARPAPVLAVFAPRAGLRPARAALLGEVPALGSPSRPLPPAAGLTEWWYTVPAAAARAHFQAAQRAWLRAALRP